MICLNIYYILSHNINFKHINYQIPARMRIQSPDIGWHGQKDRILCIDFNPFTNQFASAGSDEKKFEEEEREGTEGCIKIWEIVNNGKKLNIKINYGLMEADQNTNVVRFSPNGAFMASGSDDKSITIWQKRQNTRYIHSSQKILRWSLKNKLMGHSEDVMDLRWTRNSKYIVSAGMDGRVFIWLVQKKYHVKVLDQHTKFVQGIAIDPKFEHLVSASNDRTVKVWKAIKSKRSQVGFYCKRTIKKFNHNKKEEEDGQGKGGFRIFADQSIPTFFRRPDFSPDGQLFVLPAGIWQKTQQSYPQYCAFIYRKNYLDKPSFYIPTKGQPALVCKFCPLLFKKKNPSQGLFQQQYYMVFAVATSSSVLVFNTETLQPIYGMGNYHYAAITELAWKGAQILAISSSDGFCSFMVFEQNELGQIYTPEGQLANLMKVDPYVPQKMEKSENNPVTINQQQRVQYRQTQTGVKKKTIIPKTITPL